MRNLFGIATFGFSVDINNTEQLEFYLQAPTCNHARLCEDAIKFEVDEDVDWKGIPEELYLANWVTSFCFYRI